MGAVWMRFRSELRSRLGAMVALAVIVGVMGGVVIWAAAGARRTETAYPRFVQAQHGLDLVVNPFGRDRRRAFVAVQRLPQVADFSIVGLAFSSLRTSSGQTVTFPDVFPLASRDGRFGTTLNTLKILSGRAANPARVNEAVASFALADRLHIEAGDRVQLGYFGTSGPFGQPLPPGQTPPPISLTVVGIGAGPGEFEPVAGGYLPGFHLTPAFFRVHRDRFSRADDVVVVRLRRGAADLPAFHRGLDAIKSRMDVDFDLPLDQAKQTAGVQDATRVQAVALRALAVLVGLAGLAIFGQSLARHTFIESVEYPTLRAVGMSRSQLLAVGVIRLALIGVVGALVAGGLAIALSPLAPTGLARAAEPDPGIAVDGPVLVIGILAMVALVVLVGAIPVWRAARVSGSSPGVADAAARRPSSLARVLTRLGRAPSTVTGVRMALEPGHGRTAVPVRTTVFGTALGLFALAAAVSFGASLQHLTATRALAGWNWDAIIAIDVQGDAPKAEVLAAQRNLDRFLRTDPRVEAYAAGALPDLSVNGVDVLGIAMESRKGSVTPALAEGDLPSTPDEIALGGDTMRAAGVGVGDTVRVHESDATTTMRVVGRIAMPNLFLSFSRPGQGAAVSLDWVRRAEGDVATQFGRFITFAPGVPHREVVADLRRVTPFFFEVPFAESQGVSNLGDVSGIPLVLAGVVALLAAATLAHTLSSSVRRRGRDLAILKTVGFSRRQVTGTVAWQATTLASVALVIGVPLGVIAGRYAWNLFAGRLGVVPEAVVPVVLVLLIVPATLAIANIVAAIPGRVAAHTRPAQVLRSE